MNLIYKSIVKIFTLNSPLLTINSYVYLFLAIAIAITGGSFDTGVTQDAVSRYKIDKIFKPIEENNRIYSKLYD